MDFGLKNKRVVVTGLGALTPIGNSVSEFWDNLLMGNSGAETITYFDTKRVKTKFACQLKNYDPLNYLDRKEVRINDPYVHYALISVAEALRDSEIELSKISAERIGVIWGTGNGGISSFENGVKQNTLVEGNLLRYNPYFIPKIIVNMAGGAISIKYGIKGVNFSPVSACASSNTALIEAYNYIKLGHQDVVIAGGSDAAITEAAIAGFNACKALSVKNENYKYASRPFDSERDGFVMGEGAGAIILEDMEHALKRGARIYAEMIGGSMTSDAYHITSTHPEGEGAVRAIRNTLNFGNVKENEVDYINAHATSTKAGDISESIAIQKVFNGCKPAITATKSSIGHLLGAAGAVEAIATIKTIESSTISPIINTRNLDSDVPSELEFVIQNPEKRKINVGISNTFGFGGHNAVVAFKNISI